MQNALIDVIKQRINDDNEIDNELKYLLDMSNEDIFSFIFVNYLTQDFDPKTLRLNHLGCSLLKPYMNYNKSNLVNSLSDNEITLLSKILSAPFYIDDNEICIFGDDEIFLKLKMLNFNIDKYLKDA